MDRRGLFVVVDAKYKYNMNSVDNHLTSIKPLNKTKFNRLYLLAISKDY